MKSSYQKGLLLLLALLLCLSGCAKEEKPLPIKISLMHGWSDTSDIHMAMQRIYDDFSVQNEKIKLECLPFSDSSLVVEKANGMLQVDRMEDIVSTNGNSQLVQNVCKKGLALDLMPYILADVSLEHSIAPAVYDTWMTKNGELYTVPDALEMMGFWVNKTLFVKAGIVDSQGNALLPQTWEEFLSTSERIAAYAKESGEDIVPFALEQVQLTENLFLATLAGQGEQGFQMVQTTPTAFDNLAMRQTIAILQKIYTLNSKVDGIDNARQYFLDGKSAMYFNGVWENSLLTDMKGVGYATYPSQSGQSIAYVSASSGYVVHKHADENRNLAAVAFIRYILSDEIQTRIVHETGQAPSNPNVDVNGLSNPLLSEALQVVRGADIQIRTLTSVWEGRTADTLTRWIGLVCTQACTYERFIEAMESAR